MSESAPRDGDQRTRGVAVHRMVKQLSQFLSRDRVRRKTAVIVVGAAEAYLRHGPGVPKSREVSEYRCC